MNTNSEAVQAHVGDDQYLQSSDYMHLKRLPLAYNRR